MIYSHNSVPGTNAMENILNRLEKVTRSGTEWKAVCPSHEDRMPSLSIREDDGKILLHCHAGCKQESIMSAIGVEWCDLFQEMDHHSTSEILKRFVELSELLPGDRQVLETRGLSGEWIQAGFYCSLSSPVTRKSVQKLAEEFGNSLASTPGFTLSSGKPRLKQQSGIFLPVCDVHGNIQGGQIMTLAEPKYIWFSGDTQAQAVCHVPTQGLGRNCVRVTEGVLKADLATHLDSSTLTIGVPGVTQWKSALLVLRELQLSEIILSFDSDWETKPQVKNCLVELFHACKDMGIRTLIETWDSQYKGIDDALLAGATLSYLERPPVEIVGVNPANSYEEKEVEWIWRGWIPQGMISVLEGDPSLGKSTLCADLSMRITQGKPFPGESEPHIQGGVLFLSSEDDPGRILVPRLRSAGADLNRVYFWDKHPYFPEHFAELEQIIEQLGIVMVVFDPFFAFLGSDIDSYKDQNVRSVLSPLAKIAERTNCAMLLIRHLTKSSATVNSMYKGAGSIAVIGQARVGLYLIQDEDSEDRVLGQVKNNLAPKQASWCFEFTETENWNQTKLNWKGRSPK